MRRRARRYTPRGVRDRTGAAAERRLLDHLENRVRSSDGDLTLDSTVKELWDKYVEQLEKDQKAPDTIARYTDLSKFIIDGQGGRTLREANSTPWQETFLDTVRTKHGVGNAQKTRIVLSGMFGLACRVVEGFGKVNPVRETSPITSVRTEKRAIESGEVAQLLTDIRLSTVLCPELGKGGKPKLSRYRVPTVAEYCESADLVDLIIMFAATGLRESELLGIQRSGVDLQRKVVRIDGKVTRIPGKGLARISFDDDPKNRNRALAIPDFAVPMLTARLAKRYPTTDDVLFPSRTGTLRDPDNFNKQWRRVRAALGLEWVTTTTFRRWVFTALDNAGLTPRKVADQGGHLKPSMSQDQYMARFKPHAENASALDRAVRLSHEVSDRTVAQSGE
ncbi:tyrosine-type recombinase/integrase [Nocardia terpenica]|uniref:tyrosine-type recombinase/integrase n=1 Tax=Nocardia terpenica TaxID=455432 RepID=UPI0018937023|nr:tyrosine-type recombinase/integrase [Nocardia terpenica]MBF6061986.1 tyrosine-type recombinase/integrase [Nocardia terpenica]MBF6120757.1 tyrosine-type recombinase/integrase [Nocardia terpenica]